MKKPILIALVAFAGVGGYFGIQALTGSCCEGGTATCKNASATATTVALSEGEASASDSYGIGSVASNFTLKNAQNDKMQSLDELEGENGSIVIFTCNTCPYAVMYEDRINELHNEFASKGYPVIAINPNDPSIKPGDSYDAMKERIESKGFEFPYLFDAEQTVFPVFGATKTPHVFLLTKDNTIKYIGAIDDNAQNADSVSSKYVADAISAVTSGSEPSPQTTKAIGCSIKYKKKM